MSEPQQIVFFDGGCLLCSWVVRWTHRRDRRGEIFFAALESDFASQHRQTLSLPAPGEGAETFVFWNQKTDRISVKSDGALALLQALGGFWALLGRLGCFCPRSLRDCLYELIARNRRRWFGTSENCSLPPASLHGKVLP